jgi:hypothetical protein
MVGADSKVMPLWFSILESWETYRVILLIEGLLLSM